MQFDETLFVINVVDNMHHLINHVSDIFHFHRSYVMFRRTTCSSFAAADPGHISIDVVAEDSHLKRKKASLDSAHIAVLVWFELIFVITKHGNLMSFEEKGSWKDQDDDHQTLSQPSLLFHDVDQGVVFAVIQSRFVVQQDIEIDDKVIFVAVVVVWDWPFKHVRTSLSYFLEVTFFDVFSETSYVMIQLNLASLNPKLTPLGQSCCLDRIRDILVLSHDRIFFLLQIWCLLVHQKWQYVIIEVLVLFFSRSTSLILFKPIDDHGIVCGTSVHS